MKITKHFVTGMSTPEIKQAQAAAKIAVAQARAYEKSDGAADFDIPKLLTDAMNSCPCADDLINRPEFETPTTAVWECPHCGCHHYMRKE
jgi:hypothetical protein